MTLIRRNRAVTREVMLENSAEYMRTHCATSADLANHFVISDSTARNHLQTMRDYGAIIVVRNRGSYNGKRQAVCYGPGTKEKIDAFIVDARRGMFPAPISEGRNAAGPVVRRNEATPISFRHDNMTLLLFAYRWNPYEIHQVV
jgi:hypothetical protein